MIFDFDREALVRGIKGWAFRHGPGFQDAVQLEAKIVVQAACRVLLDDEEERTAARDDLRTRLRRDGELSLGSVAIEGALLLRVRSHGRSARFRAFGKEITGYGVLDANVPPCSVLKVSGISADTLWSILERLRLGRDPGRHSATFTSSIAGAQHDSGALQSVLAESQTVSQELDQGRDARYRQPGDRSGAIRSGDGHRRQRRCVPRRHGPGVVRRAKAAMTASGLAALDPTKLRVVFVTHLHSDHTVGYPDLIFTPWTQGRRVPLEVYGPKGIKAMTEHTRGGVSGRHRDAHQSARQPAGFPGGSQRQRARDCARRRVQGCERHGDGIRDQARNGELRLSIRDIRPHYRALWRHEPDAGHHRCVQGVRRPDSRGDHARLARSAAGQVSRLRRDVSHHDSAARRSGSRGEAETPDPLSLQRDVSRRKSTTTCSGRYAGHFVVARDLDVY